MKAFYLSCICLLSFVNEGCSQRYKDLVFDQVDVSTVTYLSESDTDLQMDIYQPYDDDISQRAVLVYVHGGGFAGGKRDEPKIITFCEDMARRGLVVVSMSYTLTMRGQSFGCNQLAGNKLATFKQVGQEIGAAVAYLHEHRSELRLDMGNIVLSGSSAGAEAVLHAAYWPETKKALPTDFTYGGVISMAGAIFDLQLINKRSAIPTQLFHGTCDNLVPYGSAPHHYCDEGNPGYLMLHGGISIANRLKELEKGYFLVTGCNGGHEWNDLPMFDYKAEIADFIYSDVINHRTSQIHEVVELNKSCAIVDEPEFCSN
ncbi:alpha/beta hydrolase [Fulvivirga sp. RKSG066]|uniref:alpha/beta hydrolase n=1 Tax=Fulvivirga aurantia TaxID=2529383 RepID=UPI0012BC94A2|nr:alpha/beta hydrolase [Fulvivirga aurantia]MTI19826.1 alpha/beta hydrolase [Fulvivirga aurantia]